MAAPDDREPDYSPWYPRHLQEVELAALKSASAQRGEDEPENPLEGATGLALSGGGVRSATFSLGLVQAMSRSGLLRKLQFLSTVSGGGYTGSFLGQLYGSLPPTPGAPQHEQVREILSSNSSSAMRWLRENGRYLNPNGAGDMPILASILLRNWLTVLAVLSSFVLTAFMALHVLRFGMAWLFEQAHLERVLELTPNGDTMFVSGFIWWSPWVVFSFVTLAFGFLAGCSFWLVDEETPSLPRRPAYLFGALLFGGFGLAAASSALGTPAPEELTSGLFAALLLFLQTLAVWFLSSRLATAETHSAGPRPIAPSTRARASAMRRWLSETLATSLTVAAGCAALAIVDSVGQSLYALLSCPEASAWRWEALACPPIVAVGAWLLQQFASRWVGGPGDRGLPVALGLLASAGALALAFTMAVSFSVVSHALSFGLESPSFHVAGKDQPNRASFSPGREIFRSLVPSAAAEWDAPPLDQPQSDRSLEWTLASLFCLGLLCGIVSSDWDFLNNSSLHAIYSARLARTYLGAANPDRWADASSNVQQVKAGENVFMDQYRPDRAGGPIHLVNVTINESIDSRSQLTNRDRNGIGMAIGPAGVSVGKRHHALWEAEGRLSPVTAAAGGFSVFPAGVHAAERLRLADWVGISGAAFSTGLGASTSLSFGFLCGAFNLRMGYWWDSGIRRPASGPSDFLGKLASQLSRAFPVPIHLLCEWTARFHGVQRPHWYLSDGGHFENMAVYELIRRRVPRIVLCDAEEDPEYTFSGLANLVRKARIDFNTDIHFLDDQQIREKVLPSMGHLFGDTQSLRRGAWKPDPVREAYYRAASSSQSRLRRELEPGVAGFSLARACIARIEYPDHGLGRAWGWLLYVKPTLMGHEPIDLLQYHQENPAFPQQTTLDQMFDEAQWECHRKLGQLIGDELLASHEGEADAQGKWTPHAWLSSPARPPPKRGSALG